MKRLLCIVLVLCMTLPFVGCVEEKPFEVTEEVTNYVCLSVEYVDEKGDAKSGDIVVELYPDKAPITVENFQMLVAKNFYDGLIFTSALSTSSSSRGLTSFEWDISS